MSQSKLDLSALEREYIITDISLREMARREGVSNSTISTPAKRANWAEKRDQYKNAELDEYIARNAEKNAKRLARLEDLTVDVLEGQLVAFAQQLTAHLDEDGKPNGKEPLFISPQDAREVIKTIQLLRGKATERTEENVRGITVHTVDNRLLEALGGAARRGLISGGAGAARSVALLGSTAGSAELDEEAESA